MPACLLCSGVSVKLYVHYRSPLRARRYPRKKKKNEKSPFHWRETDKKTQQQLALMLDAAPTVSDGVATFSLHLQGSQTPTEIQRK